MIGSREAQRRFEAIQKLACTADRLGTLAPSQRIAFMTAIIRAEALRNEALRHEDAEYRRQHNVRVVHDGPEGEARRRGIPLHSLRRAMANPGVTVPVRLGRPCPALRPRTGRVPRRAVRIAARRVIADAGGDAPPPEPPSSPAASDFGGAP